MTGVECEACGGVASWVVPDAEGEIPMCTPCVQDHVLGDGLSWDDVDPIEDLR